ncbi:uncharacterized protein CTHT_0019240 [Thermochaetoides thermophila DSM 1495]|uniref:Peptidase S33 tripeptidyl aminopeptidase-like C-terminal domain-containing protein n=1 Tax=Chaetomium thermophilum (strain DSM 1495 / CBS 144.50 / IMI 039719) TaxID=759272 RepID=G0S310_CHATD|nr:hypothetical protein CTHT_0019240 [Thermochaetoides thermophila DSM 1495]EGS22393.1 hypothetical protein CTHT_0019240 [Thermochaetoides thermophila DSM 1495]
MKRVTAKQPLSRLPPSPFVNTHIVASSSVAQDDSLGITPSSIPSPVTYPGERISWIPCGTLNNELLECTNLSVPIDHFSERSSDKTFTIPLIRLRSNRTSDTPLPNILLNPGGPGGSGTQFVYRLGAKLRDVLGDGVHLIGFDPRGVNGSIPRASCYKTPELRERLGFVRDKKVVEDSGELWAWSQNFAKACQETMGPHGKYINTPQTAADMNSILDALGQRGLWYWGFSYGTLLGQTYAALFPERTERVVIDGVANQWDWYESRLDKEMMTDTDAVWNGFIEECIKAGKWKCDLAQLASTKEELADMLLREIGKLRDDPVPVYVNAEKYGVLDYWDILYGGIFPALYKPASWSRLASNLAALLKGNATPAFLEYGQKSPFDLEGEAFKVISLNDGLSGPAHWPNTRKALLDELIPFFNQSLFSEDAFDFYFSKQAWTIPRTHTYSPPKRGVSVVQTAHPILILSTTYDPVCPLMSARAASQAYAGSRIVEVKGYGHCSTAVPSRCVANHVREYFYEGKLPKEDVQCEADGSPYFKTMEEQVAAAEALDEEDRRIRFAQLALAEEGIGPWRR